MDQVVGEDVGGDRSDGFHHNEAISAVQDEEQFYGDEEDYEDLYNDVNVGDGFHRSVHTTEDEPPKTSAAPPPIPPPRQHPPPASAAEQLEKVLIQVENTVDRSNAGFPEPAPVLPPAPVPVRPLPHPQIRPDIGQPSHANFQNEGFNRPVGGNFVGGHANANGGTSTLFVGDLHWWTTDADLEAEAAKYGSVKEVKFFDEKASGKSKGYCQLDFYDSMSASACKEGMNGHHFNGRPCVVAYSSPYGVRKMGEAHASRNLQSMQQNQTQNQSMVQKGRGGGGGPQMGGNFGGRGGGGGGNWGRGGGGGGMNRGQMGNMRNRMGPMGGRGIMGNGGMVAPPPPVMHPGAMLGQAFDYGAAAMGRMAGGYGGFPGGGAAGGMFPGMMPSFPPVVAPHVNPAFFGRGMQGGGMGMWQDPNMAGWGGEDQSSYGEDAGSDQQYGDGGSHGKERVPEREWSGAPERRQERDKDAGGGHELSERRHRDDRDTGRDREWERERERDRDRDRDRDRYHDDRNGRERHGDYHRHKERESARDDEWERGRPSRGHSHSREVENAKKRRGSE